VNAALEDALDSLDDRGIRGLQLRTDDDRTAVSVASNELIQSLNEIGEGPDLEKALAAVFETLAAAVTAAAAEEPECKMQNSECTTLRISERSCIVCILHSAFCICGLRFSAACRLVP
jgi:hypothetical protein